MPDLLAQFIDIVLHLDVHLDALVADYGIWVYAILFLIVFCETGLVVLPFLPGDSLLFAAGALSASGRLDFGVLAFLLIVAAILGNTVNYWVGRLVGHELKLRFPRLIRQDHLDKTHVYFERYGGMTIVIARFVPIVRTVAPFAAGIVLWVLLLVPAGYFFANVPFVKNNFSAVVLAIVIVSILPGIIGVVRARVAAKR